MLFMEEVNQSHTNGKHLWVHKGQALEATVEKIYNQIKTVYGSLMQKSTVQPHLSKFSPSMRGPMRMKHVCGYGRCKRQRGRESRTQNCI